MTQSSGKKGVDLSFRADSQDDRESDVMDEEFAERFRFPDTPSNSSSEECINI
jgi:hypothetical protein